jgi:hypothetical protein
MIFYTLERHRVRIVFRVEKSHFDHELCILFFPTSLMKMSLNFKFLYTYFTPLFLNFPDLEFQLMQITVF